MTPLRTLAASLILCASASSAVASPIPFAGGLLDGVLRTYTPHIGSNGFEAVLLHEYVLGTDFYPAVPLSFQSTATPYSRCVGGPHTTLPDCIFAFEAVTTDGGDLKDGCSSIGLGPGQSVFRAVMVARGGCTFSQKWAFAESAGWGGIMVVNEAPGSVGPVGIVAIPISSRRSRSCGSPRRSVTN